MNAGQRLSQFLQSTPPRTVKIALKSNRRIPRHASRHLAPVTQQAPSTRYSPSSSPRAGNTNLKAPSITNSEMLAPSTIPPYSLSLTQQRSLVDPCTQKPRGAPKNTLNATKPPLTDKNQANPAFAWCFLGFFRWIASASIAAAPHQVSGKKLPVSDT